AAELDELGPKTALTKTFLALRPESAWPGYLAQAGKRAIAALAQDVAHAATGGDEVAGQCIQQEAEAYARLIAALGNQLGSPGAFRLLVHGGVFRNCAGFHAAFENA